MDAVQPAKIARDSLLITTWALTGAALAFFLSRLGIRRRFTTKLWLDDWISGAATGFLFAQSLITTLMTSSMYETLSYSNTKPMTQHGFSLSTQSFMRSQFAQEVCFWTCIWLVKASFLTLSFRLLPSHLRFFTIAWCTIAGLTALFYVITVISFPIACSALSPPFCSGSHSVNLSQVSLRLTTSLDIISNIFIIALPIALSFRANLPRRSTLTLIAIFSSITLIVIMSILRLISSEGNESDWPEVTALNLWSAIEAGIAVIIVNVAEFKLLFSINQASRPASSHPFLKERTSTVPATVRTSILSPPITSQTGVGPAIALTPRDPRERISVVQYRASAREVPYLPDPGPTSYSPPILSDVSDPANRTHLEPPSSSIDSGSPARRWSDPSSHGGMEEVVIGHELDDAHAEAARRNDIVLHESRMSRNSSAIQVPTQSPARSSRHESVPISASVARDDSFGVGAGIGAGLDTQSALDLEKSNDAGQNAEHKDGEGDDVEDEDDDNGNGLIIQGGESEIDDAESGLENYDLGGLSYYLPATPEAPRAQFYNL